MTTQKNRKTAKTSLNDPTSVQAPEVETRNWTVYILFCGDGSYYTGITNNPNRRLEQHLSGKASRYTRCRLPVTFAYQEFAPTHGEALKREAAIKRLHRKDKSTLIRGFQLTQNKPDASPSKIKKSKHRGSS